VLEHYNVGMFEGMANYKKLTNKYTEKLGILE